MLSKTNKTKDNRNPIYPKIECYLKPIKPKITKIQSIQCIQCYLKPIKSKITKTKYLTYAILSKTNKIEDNGDPIIQCLYRYLILIIHKITEI